MKSLDLPTNIGAPATRALAGANIKDLKQLSKYTEKEIINLHGVGPKAIRLLKEAMKRNDLNFKN